MKKIILGLAIVAMAAATSAFTDATMNATKNLDNEQVGYLGQDNWVLAPPSEENSSWKCSQNGTQCLGTLKDGAMPQTDGSYLDDDVEPISDNRKFELIPQ